MASNRGDQERWLRRLRDAAIDAALETDGDRLDRADLLDVVAEGIAEGQRQKRLREATTSAPAPRNQSTYARNDAARSGYTPEPGSAVAELLRFTANA